MEKNNHKEKEVQIKTIKNAGFCYGVERAYHLAIKALKQPTGPIYSLGDLIHNKQVVTELNSLGAKPIKTISDILPEDKQNNKQDKKQDKASIIIRAHGISKEVNQEIKDNNLHIIDATCPFVKVPQRAVKKYSDLGYFIFIAGDEGHPEVEGIKSYVPKENRIITSSISGLKEKLKVKREEIEKKKEKTSLFKKSIIVSQTTLSFEIFSSLALHLMKEIEELIVINSICDATTVRQKETRELAKESDIMIVIGGRHSANTKRLTEIASEYTTAIQIETEFELLKKMFHNKKNIGVTAGASTPHWIIERVEKKIQELSE